MANNLLASLNEAQRKAVETIDGPVMVIAGAGSGKTRVLTYRIAHMIDQGIDPFRILALTFTNKAAAEMKERVVHLLDNAQARYVWMGTFHSVFSKILHIEAAHLGYTSNFTIYDTYDSQSLIKNIVKELNLDPKLYKPNQIANRISQAKSQLLSADAYLQNPEFAYEDKARRLPETGNIFKIFSKRLRQADAMDFDDLLYYMHIMLSQHPDLLDKYQNKFRYILVDEYQDTNFAQYLIIKKLAALRENICVVGDDAQSIYSFRGANIQNILNFKNDYPDFKIFKLEQNYRSTKNILAAANSVIQNNRNQIFKTIWTDNPTGEKIRVCICEDDVDEATQIVKKLIEKKQAFGAKNMDFAILYRTNSQSRNLEEVLRRKNLPYKIYGGLSFYSRKEIKDVLAYFKLTVNPRDEEALRRVINYPQRGIGLTSVQKMIAAASELNVSLWSVVENPKAFQINVSPATLKAIEGFVNKIKSYRADLDAKNAFELGQYIIKDSGIEKDLEEQPEEKDRFDNLGELLNALNSFVDNFQQREFFDNQTGELIENSFASLGLFLNEVVLYTDADKENPEDNDKIKLMTIHSAKGLEFDHVFIAGVEEGLMPIYMIQNQSDLEEERRLFYVASTRARKTLLLSLAKRRMSFGQYQSNAPSPFLTEIDPQYLNIESCLSARKPLNMPFEDEFPSKNAVFVPKSQPKHQFNAQSTSINQAKKVSVTPENLGAIVENPKQLSEGTKVFHAQFGVGIVERIELLSLKVVVNFEQVGRKTMLLKFAKLRIIL